MKTKIILSLLFILFFLAGCSDSTKYDAFAQCLTKKGVTMYGTEWCPHCKNQKKAFGSSFQYIDYVDCDINKNACLSAGVKGYPTWVIDGQNYPGDQPLYNLARFANCELP